MNIVSLSEVSFRYGPRILLDTASLGVAKGDRLALTGPNGCGKTTLMKIIAGKLDPDSGLVEKINGLKLAYLPQEVPENLSGKIIDLVSEGLEGHREPPSDENFEFWNTEAKISSVLDSLGLKPDLETSEISAGLKRRALLARELISDPDLLMLDEPTNHLDISSVVWLENFLKSSGKTLIFVSHDRTFLRNLATRVVEVDRGKLISFSCGFDEFVRRRDEFLEAQRRNDEEFDKKLKREESWLRRGVKARRTRNEGRVKELMKLRKIRAARMDRSSPISSLNIGESCPTGRKVFEIKNLEKSFGDRKIVGGFSTTIYRGDKIGIVGPNGIGKTTLVKLILGKLEPDSGEVKFGTKLEIAYFDQLRGKLDPQSTPYEFIGESSDTVYTPKGGQNVMGYLQNFLFTPNQILGKISMLSGGERNRLMLAKLMASPSNVLVLDEPTNDLDMETLELLENALSEFDGTILLVSHDRAFLNNTTTAIFGFEGNGKIVELVGGYDEWEAYLQKKYQPSPAEKQKPRRIPAKREKFTNKDREELECVQKRIAEVESESSEISSKLSDSEFVRLNASKLGEISERFEELKKEEEKLLERWSELEEKRERLG